MGVPVLAVQEESRSEQLGAEDRADQLPAVTQLFTEPYMVSFLLDNSLGAWWATRRLTDSDLKAADSEAELRGRAALPRMPLDYLRFVRCDESPERARWRPASGAFDCWPEHLGDLKVLDPCCGSGHFLVAALAMLVPMRVAREGLTEGAAVDAVIRDNLYGLELDPRCVALAAFALAFAAWTWPGAGGYRVLPELNLACSGLAPEATKEEWSALAEQAPPLEGCRLSENCSPWKIRCSPRSFEAAWTRCTISFGRHRSSVLSSTRALSGSNCSRATMSPCRRCSPSPVTQERTTVEETERAVAAQGMARAAELLAGSYHLVNYERPYLARRKHDPPLRDICERYYDAAKNDLATVFLERCLALCAEGGAVSLVLPQNWLFSSATGNYARSCLKNETWQLLARLGAGAFDTISGEVVKQSCLP